MEKTEDDEFSYEAFLGPIAAESPVGVDVSLEGLYEKLGELLVAGNWEKVQARCAELLSSKTKDLAIATFFVQSMAKLQGLSGIKNGLLLLTGLHQRYWPDMYPRREADDPPATLIWLNKLDRFLEQIVLLETPLTISFEGKSYSLAEWQNNEHVLRETAAALRSGKMRDAERKDALRDKGQSEVAKAQSLRAISATNRRFYEDKLIILSGQGRESGCLQTISELVKVVEEKFESDSSIDRKEYPPPNFRCLRTALTDYALVVSGILEDKPKSQEVEHDVSESLNGESDSGQLVSGVRPGSREDAICQLKRIASFFQETEPHSPIGYLILRAVRWAEMSLDDWLDEVIKEPAALGKIRETLGIQPKSKADEASNNR